MARRVTHEQIEQIINHLQNGAAGKDVAGWTGVHVSTVKKIHAHASRVGHYKSVRLTQALPAWSNVNRNGRRFRTMEPSVKKALSRLGPATAGEISVSLEESGVPVAPGVLYGILSRMVAKGHALRWGNPYIFTLNPDTKEPPLTC